jgi:hypothetical protein
MKYAVGIMACIAIAFLFITSPDKSRSHAQEEVAAVAPVVDDKLDSIIGMLAKQQVNIEGIDSVVVDVASEQDAIKQRLVKLETAKEETPSPAKPQAELCECNCDCDAKLADHEKRIAALEAVKNVLSRTAVSGGSTGGPVVSYGSTGGSAVSQGPVVRTPVRSVVQAAANVATAPVRAANYQPRWQNYDGKSRMQHAVEDHGMDISGKSQAQVLAEMDAYHDRFGPGHPVKVSSSVPMQRQTYSSGGCPGGVCPTNPSVQTRSSGGGWFLGKNLRR